MKVSQLFASFVVIGLVPYVVLHFRGLLFGWISFLGNDLNSSKSNKLYYQSTIKLFYLR